MCRHPPSLLSCSRLSPHVLCWAPLLYALNIRALICSHRAGSMKCSPPHFGHLKSSLCFQVQAMTCFLRESLLTPLSLPQSPVYPWPHLIAALPLAPQIAIPSQRISMSHSSLSRSQEVHPVDTDT